MEKYRIQAIDHRCGQYFDHYSGYFSRFLCNCFSTTANYDQTSSRFVKYGINLNQIYYKLLKWQILEPCQNNASQL